MFILKIYLNLRLLLIFLEKYYKYQLNLLDTYYEKNLSIIEKKVLRKKTYKLKSVVMIVRNSLTDAV